MNTVRSTFRWIITASLLLSLSMTSLYPRVMAGGEGTVAASADQGQKVCCCGTEDGRCCGMACCQMPNPKQDNTPASPKPSEDRGQPFGLMLAADAPLDGSNAATFRHDLARNAAVIGSTSLIALSIRLNI